MSKGAIIITVVLAPFALSLLIAICQGLYRLKDVTREQWQTIWSDVAAGLIVVAVFIPVSLRMEQYDAGGNFAIAAVFGGIALGWDKIEALGRRNRWLAISGLLLALAAAVTFAELRS